MACSKPCSPSCAGAGDSEHGRGVPLITTPPGCTAGRRRKQKPLPLLRPEDRVKEARFLKRRRRGHAPRRLPARVVFFMPVAPRSHCCCSWPIGGGTRRGKRQ